MVFKQLLPTAPQSINIYASDYQENIEKKQKSRIEGGNNKIPVAKEAER